MFAEDLSVFFNPEEFGNFAVLDWDEVTGLFDSDYVQAFDGISATATVFILPTASALGATTSSLLAVNGSTYRVRSIQPDSNGVTTLLLERQ